VMTTDSREVETAALERLPFLVAPAKGITEVSGRPGADCRYLFSKPVVRQKRFPESRHWRSVGDFATSTAALWLERSSGYSFVKAALGQQSSTRQLHSGS
jgi:hypothetical protein